MRIGITTFPENSFEIWQRTGMTSIVRLYKDLQTDVVADETRLTANMVDVYMPQYDGLYNDVLNDFEYYWTEGLKLELEQAKIKKREEIKSRLLTVEYDVLMAQYKAVDEAMTVEEVELI